MTKKQVESHLTKISAQLYEAVGSIPREDWNELFTKARERLVDLEYGVTATAIAEDTYKALQEALHRLQNGQGHLIMEELARIKSELSSLIKRIEKLQKDVFR